MHLTTGKGAGDSAFFFDETGDTAERKEFHLFDWIQLK